MTQTRFSNPCIVPRLSAESPARRRRSAKLLCAAALLLGAYCATLHAYQTLSKPPATPPDKSHAEKSGQSSSDSAGKGGSHKPRESAQNLNKGQDDKKKNLNTQDHVVWSIGAPPPQVRYPKQWYVYFTVTAGDKDIKGLELKSSTLQDQSSELQHDPLHVKLCEEIPGKDDNCGSVDVAANTTKRVKLWIHDFYTPGNFTGNITLGPGYPSDTQFFQLTVHSRRPWPMAWGGGTIAVGLLLYFVVNVFLRRRIALESALLPAYQLRDTLSALHAKVDAAAHLTGVPMPQTLLALTTLLDDLSPKEISRKVPSVFQLSNPFGSSSTLQNDLARYLTQRSDKAAALAVLVNSGIETAVGFWPGHAPAVTSALTQIDPLATVAANANAAQTSLAPILSQLLGAVNPPLVAAMPGPNPGALAARMFALPTDTQTLEVRLSRDSLWVWVIVAVIALFGGFYAVVFQNYGFGVGSDYFKCLFWGLGFSAAGSQLDQLTQNSVVSNFGITIPKA